LEDAQHQMTRFELRQKLIVANVDPRFFSIDEVQKDESLVLQQQSADSWVVYYFERGLRTNELHFGSENGACEYMLTSLLRDPTVKKKND
jgi:hypothetical protein